MNLFDTKSKIDAMRLSDVKFKIDKYFESLRSEKAVKQFKDLGHDFEPIEETNPQITIVPKDNRFSYTIVDSNGDVIFNCFDHHLTFNSKELAYQDAMLFLKNLNVFK